MQIITLSIPNWEKYNPRADRNNYSWFRFQNNFFTDSQIFGLSLLEKMLLVFIYSEASKKGSATCEINIGLAAALLGASVKDCELALKKLNEINVVSFDNQTPPNGGEEPAFGSPTNERTNERTDNTPLDLPISQSENSSFCETENQELQINPNQAKSKKSLIHKSNIQSKLEFIYSIYPRKERKKKGFEILSKLSLEELDRVELSVKNYALICEYEKKEKQYIRQFSTFANSWEDFYEANPDDYKSPAMVAEERIDAALELYKQQAEI